MIMSRCRNCRSNFSRGRERNNAGFSTILNVIMATLLFDLIPLLGMKVAPFRCISIFKFNVSKRRIPRTKFNLFKEL